MNVNAPFSPVDGETVGFDVVLKRAVLQVAAVGGEGRAHRPAGREHRIRTEREPRGFDFVPGVDVGVEPLRPKRALLVGPYREGGHVEGMVHHEVRHLSTHADRFREHACVVGEALHSARGRDVGAREHGVREEGHVAVLESLSWRPSNITLKFLTSP